MAFTPPREGRSGAAAPDAQPRACVLDAAACAVLRECRYQTLTVGSILCRQLDEGMCILEAAEAEEKATQRRGSVNSASCTLGNVRGDDRSDTQVCGTADSTDPDREPSLFIPTVETETDSAASQMDASALSNRNTHEYSLGHMMSRWSKGHMGIHTFTSLGNSGQEEKAENLFPYPNGRWECGTFAGKRVFLETTNAVLGRGSLAVVLEGRIVIEETADDVEGRRTSVPVAIKGISYDARQKAVRNMLEAALRFRLEVSHPGIVYIFHTGCYYPPFSRLSTTAPVLLHSHLTMACSTIGSIADVLKRSGPFHETEIQRCVAEVLVTLQFMHEERRTVHNDIKSHNILIFTDPVACFSDFRYQLTDFTGLARAQTPAAVMHDLRSHHRRDDLSLATVGGTAVYMSPESCLGLGMLTSNDIWSLGITVYHMATNTLPWKPLERQFPSMILNGYRCKFSLDTIFGAHGEGPHGAVFDQASTVDRGGQDASPHLGSSGSASVSSSSAGNAILHEKYGDFGPILEEFDQGTLSSDLEDFVRQCLVENPIDRPTASQLREHPFVKGVGVGSDRGGQSL